MLYIIHHWWLPIIGWAAWFSMLWAMLGWWIAQGKPRYPWQDGSIAFISDIGATKTMQPVFIACTSVMAICFVLSVAADRLLRHQSRLPRNMRRTERVLSYCAIAGATIGGVAITLVSCFNTNSFPRAHDVFLLFFMIGVALSAIFTTAELGLLDVYHKDHQRIHGLLRLSYILKIVLVVVDVALAIAFGITLFQSDSVHNVSAVLEWAVAFIFTFYLLTFVLDLWPARVAEKGTYEVENGYAVEGFPREEAEGAGAAEEMRAQDSRGTAPTMTSAATRREAVVPATVDMDEYPASGGNVHVPVRELGRTGGATIVGTGQEAHAMEAHDGRRPKDSGTAVRHIDDYGRPQAAL